MIGGLALLCATSLAEVIEIGGRRELFVVDHLVESVAGMERVQHAPQPREIVFLFDRPWEKYPGYLTVLRYEGGYRLYYRTIPGEVSDGDARQLTCVLESPDGLHWTRPNLGLVTFDGGEENNIILRGVTSHNFTPFRAGGQKRDGVLVYGAVGGLGSGRGDLRLFASSDGLRWEPVRDQPLPFPGKFDSQNAIIWDEVSGVYRAYWRDTRGDGDAPGRDVRTAESPDLVRWSDSKWLSYWPNRAGTDRKLDLSLHQFYTHGVFPYHRAPHILIGLPMVYVDRGWVESTGKLPDQEARRAFAAQGIAGGRPTRLGSAVLDHRLMASRDGSEFKVWPRAFLPPGPQRPGGWFYRNLHLALGSPIETRSPYDGAAPELSFYRTEIASAETEQVHLRRYALRLDGLVSFSAGIDGGVMTTKPLRFAGNALSINFATSAAGSLRIEILDDEGVPILGYRMEESHEQFGDEIERIVSWERGADVAHLAGRPVKLRFHLRDADLYSFRFVDRSVAEVAP